MNLHPRLLPLLCSALACAAQPGDDASKSTTTISTSGQSETGVLTTSTSTSTSESTTTPTATASDHTSFIIGPDGGHSDHECDVYAQECPAGEKCTWWAEGGGSFWNASKCVPVADDPTQLGQPCVAEGGGVSGIDDCDLGLLCWDVDDHGDGHCIAYCAGDPGDPTCPEGQVCTGGRSGFALCLPTCDPLAQNCPAGELCLAYDYTFVCTLDASGAQGQLHDPCEYANACDPGLLCVGAGQASECDQSRSGCCEPMCDLNQPNTCPGAGQVCQSIYEPPAPGFEHVGYCGVPQ